MLDIKWWQKHLLLFNGTLSITPIVFPTTVLGDDMYIATDASNKGYGAICGKYWITGVWSEQQLLDATSNDRTPKLLRHSMPYLELLSLTIAISTWGYLFKHKNITFHVDCEPIVYALNKGDSRRDNLMSLIRTIASLSVFYDFNYRLTHIAGVKNVFADALSRPDLVSTFFSLPCPPLHSFHPLPSIPIFPRFEL